MSSCSRHSASRQEIGIRMALGAAPEAIVRLVMGRVWLLVGTGVTIGAVASIGTARLAASLLFGVGPRDPAVHISAAAVLAAAGSIAGWLPAWRASRVDPADVLRDA